MNSLKIFLKSQFLLLLAFVILAIGVAFSIFVYNKDYKNGLKNILSRVDTISTFIDHKDIQDLNGDLSDLSNKDYISIKSKLGEIVEHNDDVIFAYLMGYKNGNLYIIADSEPTDSEDYSPPGQIYHEESAALMGGFINRVSSTEGPTRDRWGTWITGASPIFDDNEKVVAVVGIDIDAENYQKIALSNALVILMITLIISILIIALHIIILKEEKNISIKEQFTAIAAHEIRSPLSGILWGINTLTRGSKLRKKDINLLNDMYAHGQRLMTTIHNILDTYSDNYNNRKETDLNIGEIIEDIIESLKLTAQQKNNTIIFNKKDFNFKINGNKEKITNALTNVISNAVKYNRVNENIEINRSRDIRYNKIEIKDKGIGIPKDEIDMVTKGFYRAKNARESDIPGSGLGLFLVDKIMKKSGGKLDVLSDENGTTVVLSFPL